MPGLSSTIMNVSAFRAGFREFFGESLNHQSCCIETITSVLIRHTKYTVHMMRSSPWLDHRLCGAEPILLRYNRRFRTTIGEWR